MRGIMKTLTALALLGAFIATAPAPTLANDLDVDLSKPDVRLDVSFKGSELLLFGAKDHPGEIIVVVRGPGKDTSMRLKERMAGIWVSTDEVIFENVPSYYALASSKPLEDLLPKETLLEEKIGTDHLGLKVKTAPENATPETIKNFESGLLRNMISKALYTAKSGPVDQVGKKLFRTNLWFPANVHVGSYVIDTYLVRDGRIQNRHSTEMKVHKVGIEAEVYSFAHEHALIYGLLAILIAGVSGWLANAVFKKRG